MPLKAVSKTFTGWQHVFETPRESMTFPQLVMQRFSVHDQDNGDLLDVDSGFYRPTECRKLR